MVFTTPYEPSQTVPHTNTPYPYAQPQTTVDLTQWWYGPSKQQTCDHCYCDPVAGDDPPDPHLACCKCDDQRAERFVSRKTGRARGQ